MTKYAKRDATSDEAAKALDDHATRWNLCNPNYQIPREDWQAKEATAVAEGYKSERCDCGVVFCAFHHYTDCRDEKCPFRDGPSLLERILGSREETA